MNRSHHELLESFHRRVQALEARASVQLTARKQTNITGVVLPGVDTYGNPHNARPGARAAPQEDRELTLEQRQVVRALVKVCCTGLLIELDETYQTIPAEFKIDNIKAFIHQHTRELQSIVNSPELKALVDKAVDAECPKSWGNLRFVRESVRHTILTQLRACGC